ncbi:YkuS family protein [Desulfovirgula thermocuniculi]|uniref:YkuS family protein n=1 Tax=Desulfovirgula thermocuniculi TaxID=348842 RepID=UPI00041C966F|nr:YkuS family protein [Desulfovirgula thermocuniculi]
MQRKKVAVEDSLTGVKNLLERKGYQVVSPQSGEEVVATVLTGLDNNVMNMQDIAVRGRVIDAAGMTPEEVLARLEELA